MKEWKTYKLGDIVDANISLYSSKDKWEKALYLDTGNITENKIDLIQEYDCSSLPSRARRKVEHGNILFSTVRPNQRHYGYVIYPASNLLVSTGFAVLSVKNEYADSKFIYYWLTRNEVISYLQNIAEQSVSAYPSIKASDICQLNISLPKLKVQQDIASVLSSLDDKIELNRRINDNLEAMAKQLYDYWFVQFDFPNEEGKPYKSSGGKMVWNEKLKREIPKRWCDGSLSEIANITMGQSPDGSSYNETGEGILFYQGSTDFGMRFPSVRQYTTAPSRYAKKGDILMSVRAPVGAVNIANNDCCIGRGLSALNSKIGSATHLYYILNDLRIAFDQRNTAGTTFGSITKDDLYSLPVVVPSINTIKAFDDICSTMYDRQMILGEEIELLTKQRDELLPLLMNGQVSVNSDLFILLMEFATHSVYHDS